MSDIITLNVGGVTYITTKQTLMVPSSYFECMFSGQMKPGVYIDDDIFIDRDGKIFRHVLNYLRNRDRWIPPSDIELYGDLLNEADFYGLTEMKKILLNLKPDSFSLYISHYKHAINNIGHNGCLPQKVDQYFSQHFDNFGNTMKPKDPLNYHLENIIKIVYPQYHITHTSDSEILTTYVFTSTLESNILHHIQSIHH